MPLQNTSLLQLFIPSTLTSSFYPLFQHGFHVELGTDESIRTLLHDRLGLDSDYIDKTVQTIFVNHDAVDDLDVTKLRNGDELALSGAMPGLAGAVLRRGGKLACLREAISHKPETITPAKTTGVVLVKIFNVLLDDLVVLFLKKGAIFKKGVFLDFVRGYPINFWKKCSPIYLDDKVIEPKELQELEKRTKAKYINLVNARLE